MLTTTEAAEKVDRCIQAGRRHGSVDRLRQELIEEVLRTYKEGADDAKTEIEEQPCQCRSKVPRTKRQAEILEYYFSFEESHSHRPTYQQICRHFGISSKATVAKHMKALRRQGFITEE